METQEKQHVFSRARIPNEELEQYPIMYKHTLDTLVYELERAWNRSNNTP